MAATTKRIVDFLKNLYRLPEHLPAEVRHAYVINNYMFTYAFFGHLSFTPVFFYLGNPLVFANNVICVILDLLVIMLNTKGWIRLSAFIWITEVSYHAFTGGMMYGWQPGFYYYFLGLSSLVFFSSIYSSLKVTLELMLFSLLAVLYIYSQYYPPVTVLTPALSGILHFGNALACFAGLSYICFYYIKVVDNSARDLKVERDKLKSRNMQIEKEIHLAKKIQQQFIPSGSPAAYIHALYKPMDLVGGDFYDFITFTDSDRIGIFISDVSGHGVPAAFITSMIKTAIMQAGAEREDPAKLFNYLNDSLYLQTGNNFVTAFYGIYNESDRSMIYSNAGHNPPYVISGEDVGCLKNAKSIPLAIMNNREMGIRDKTFRNEKVDLKEKSKLLIYTDGLTEARPLNGQDVFSENGILHNVFSQHQNLPCGAFVTHIFSSLQDFRGADSFEDDVCIICVDVH